MTNPAPDRPVQPPLVLRPLSIDDELQARVAHVEVGPEGFGFLMDLRDGEPWEQYLGRLEDQRHGRGLPERWVPGTFLVGEVGGRLVGRVSVRHRLNDWLLRYGGHIGYGVRPADRRRGYATEMLRQALGVAAAEGVERALVTCDDDNVGSARVIEVCGGVLENLVPGGPGEPAKRRYWIPTG